MTSFQDFADLCHRVEGISSSLEMTQVVAEFLSDMDDDELEIMSRFIMGQVFPVWSPLQLGIGPSLLYTSISKASGRPVKHIVNLVKKTGDVGLAAKEALSGYNKTQATFAVFEREESVLSLKEVHTRFTDIARMSGKGSQTSKVKHLQFMFSQATPVEAIYLARLAIEELRIGVGEGIVRDAIARAFHVPKDLVERANMITNDLGLVARQAKQNGIEGLKSLDIQPGHPIKLMLAQVAEGIQAALDEMGTVAVEWKFDGARVQIHKNGNEVILYSRRLENVTDSLPDIVDMVKAGITVHTAILDGEVVVLGEDGKPGAFQQILKRFRRKYHVDIMKGHIPLQMYLFDILFINGQSLFDYPLLERRQRLMQCVASGSTLKVAEQVVTNDSVVIHEMYARALDAGHEGIMIKNPVSFYSPGKRGKHWLKVKPVMETLDLVVIGGEWGEGRRATFIGSYLLACVEPETGKFLSIGRVATGITDDMLSELTSLFQDYIVIEKGKELEFVPEVVFEVAFEEIQESPTYNSGYALRFPRLIRVRDDKSAEEIDPLDRIEQMYISQKGRGNHG